jgi:DNA-binding GntR family transcriptional regulator
MPEDLQLPLIEAFARPSVTDQVFDEMRRQILSLELPPGTKVSEVEVGKQMGVSRQPVRDAFYRLSKLGFLQIRPQRATTVSLISAEAVRRARFIRTAIEIETCRAAAEMLGPEDFAALDALLAGQEQAINRRDPDLFHRLDDQFHKEICDRAGFGFAWDLIRENKGHMDRVRLLSLSFASRQALDDHSAILSALRAHDPDRATVAIRVHLARISEMIQRIRDANHSWFLEQE